MTPDEFVRRAVGLPWVRWRCDWFAADCFGLIVLWFREVLHVELGQVPQTDIADGFAHASGWTECEAEPFATAWMAWRDGAPRHCGILLPGGRVLHSEGSENHPGNVRVSRLSSVAKIHGDLKFYRYEAPTCSPS